MLEAGLLLCTHKRRSTSRLHKVCALQVLVAWDYIAKGWQIKLELYIVRQLSYRQINEMECKAERKCEGVCSNEKKREKKRGDQFGRHFVLSNLLVLVGEFSGEHVLESPRFHRQHLCATLAIKLSSRQVLSLVVLISGVLSHPSTLFLGSSSRFGQVGFTLHVFCRCQHKTQWAKT